MKTEIIPTADPRAVPRALEVLAGEGIVAFPTDTVYGLGALVGSARGIERLFAAKGRDPAKAIAVLLGEVDQVDQVAAGMSPAARGLAEKFWPGALTLIVTRRADLPEEISPLPTVGLRIPDHPFARALLRRSGPLATTSANRSGGENPLRAQDVLDQLDGLVDLVLDGGSTPGGVPSTVVDCTGAEIRILREGPISGDQIREFLRKYPN